MVSNTPSREKPELVFTFPACMGGVASLNFNLINHSRMIREFHSRVVLLKAEEDHRPDFLDPFNADETIRFRYSLHENRYAVCRRLAAILGNCPGAIVCENMLTLQAAALFDCPKTVFHYLHDFYYVKQNIEAGNWVDVVVSHSTFFSDCAYAANPKLFVGRHFYIPYGVRQLPTFPAKEQGLLNLVFLGRLVESKGIDLLPPIDTDLRARGIDANWTIIGKGPLRPALEKHWQRPDRIAYHEPATTAEVYNLLARQDIFVFPTSLEGTPVSILECLANGVVTIVSDLPGGIRDIVKDGIGHRVGLGDARGFAEAIARLHSNRKLLLEMQRACFEMARRDCDIEKNADAYFRLFLKYASFRRRERHGNYQLGRLDLPWLSTGMTRTLRGVIRRLRGR